MTYREYNYDIFMLKLMVGMQIEVTERERESAEVNGEDERMHTHTQVCVWVGDVLFRGNI